MGECFCGGGLEGGWGWKIEGGKGMGAKGEREAYGEDCVREVGSIGDVVHAEVEVSGSSVR